MLLALIIAVSIAAATGICLLSGGFAGLGWLWMIPVLSLGFVILGIVLAFLFLLLLASVVDLKEEQKEEPNCKECSK